MKTTFLILLFILILFFGTADAANPVRLKSFSASGGILLPQDNWDNGFSIELQSDFGEIIKYVFLFPHIGYWQAGMNKEGMDLSYTDIFLGTKFIGYFNSKPRGFYAGLGVQYHIIGMDEISGGFDTIDDTITKQNFTRVGYSVIAGYLFKLKKVSFSIEPGYTIIPGADNMITINLGIGYLLP